MKIKNVENVTYFVKYVTCGFGIQYIPKGITNFIRNKNITTNTYRIQAYELIMCGYFDIGFIDFMLKGKSLFEYINLFSPNKYKNNYKIIFKYFQQNLNKFKCIVMFPLNIENLEKLKYHIFLRKH